MNQIFEFDNGFPATSRREFEHNGQKLFGSVQEGSGLQLDQALRNLSTDRGGDGSSASVAKMVQGDPVLRRQVEQAFVERLIIGDSDNHSGNFVAKGEGADFKIQSIDLDFAFGVNRVPAWHSDFMKGVNRELFLDFSQRTVSAELLGKLRNFLEKHDSVEGRARLTKLGLTETEVDNMIARTRWFVDGGKFPVCTAVAEAIRLYKAARPGEDFSHLPTKPSDSSSSSDLSAQRPGDFAMWSRVEYAVDPASTKLALAGSDLRLPRGAAVGLGRDHQPFLDVYDRPEGNSNVSRRHAMLSRDEAGNYFIVDTGSSNGTFIRREGDRAFTQITGRELVGPNDVVMLGGTGDRNLSRPSQPGWRLSDNRKGTELRIVPDVVVPTLEPRILPPTEAIVEPGEFYGLGRSFQPELGDPRSTTHNRNVSRNHALVTRDNHGNYFIEDNGSTLGTFVRKAGEAEFRQLHGREQVGPDDVIMLGGISRRDAECSHVEFLGYPQNRRGTEVILRATDSQAKTEPGVKVDLSAMPAIHEPVPAVLRISDGVSLPLDLPLNGEYVVGREVDGVTHGTVSRRHTKVTRDVLGFIVEDAGSTNGTWYRTEADGKPVRLKPGERVRLEDVYEVLIAAGPKLEGGLHPNNRFTEGQARTSAAKRAMMDWDPAQRDLATGEIFGDVYRFSAGNSGHEAYRGEVRVGDQVHEVIVRNFSDAAETARFRKEAAAYKLNSLLEFDNGFPVTSTREFMHDGEAKYGSVQEASGRQFDQSIRELAAERHGGDASSDSVSRLLQEEPIVKRQVEQAFLERLIYGDSDNHAANFIMHGEGTSLRVQNIDLDYGFPPDTEPSWLTHGMQGVNRVLNVDFSEQPINPEFLAKVRRFVEKHDNMVGRRTLMNLGLTGAEVNGMLGRAKWLAENGRFPYCMTVQEVLARAEAEASKSQAGDMAMWKRSAADAVAVEGIARPRDKGAQGADQALAPRNDFAMWGRRPDAETIERINQVRGDLALHPRDLELQRLAAELDTRYTNLEDAAPVRDRMLAILEQQAQEFARKLGLVNRDANGNITDYLIRRDQIELGFGDRSAYSLVDDRFYLSVNDPAMTSALYHEMAHRSRMLGRAALHDADPVAYGMRVAENVASGIETGFSRRLVPGADEPVVGARTLVDPEHRRAMADLVRNYVRDNGVPRELTADAVMKWAADRPETSAFRNMPLRDVGTELALELFNLSMVHQWTRPAQSALDSHPAVQSFVDRQADQYRQAAARQQRAVFDEPKLRHLTSSLAEDVFSMRGDAVSYHVLSREERSAHATEQARLLSLLLKRGQAESNLVSNVRDNLAFQARAANTARALELWRNADTPQQRQEAAAKLRRMALDLGTRIPTDELTVAMMGMFVESGVVRLSDLAPALAGAIREAGYVVPPEIPVRAAAEKAAGDFGMWDRKQSIEVMGRPAYDAVESQVRGLRDRWQADGDQAVLTETSAHLVRLKETTVRLEAERRTLFYNNIDGAMIEAAMLDPNHSFNKIAYKDKDFNLHTLYAEAQSAAKVVADTAARYEHAVETRRLQLEQTVNDFIVGEHGHPPLRVIVADVQDAYYAFGQGDIVVPRTMLADDHATIGAEVARLTSAAMADVAVVRDILASGVIIPVTPYLAATGHVINGEWLQQIRAVTPKDKLAPDSRAARFRQIIAEQPADNNLTPPRERVWTEEHRQLMLNRAPHFNEALALRFNDAVEALVERWSAPARDQMLSAEEVHRAHFKLTKAIEEARKNGLSTDEILDARIDASHEANHRFRTKDGSINDLHRDWEKKSRIHAEQTRADKDSGETRCRQLELAINEVITEYNSTHPDTPMPRIRIEGRADLKGAGGDYTPGTGKVRLLSKYLLANIPADVANLVHHEVVHSDQDMMVVRLAIEQVQAQDLPATFQNVAAHYQGMSGAHLMRSWFTRVNEISRGLPPLTELQKTRAMDFITDLTDSPFHNAQTARQNADVLQSKLRSLEFGESSNELLRDMLRPANTPTMPAGNALSHRVLGFDGMQDLSTLPPGIAHLIHEWLSAEHDSTGLAKTFDDQRAANILHGFLRGRLRDENQRYRFEMDRYYGSISEQEAYGLSSIIRSTPRGAGSGDMAMWGLGKGGQDDAYSGAGDRQPRPGAAAEDPTIVHARTLLRVQAGENPYLQDFEANQSAPGARRAFSERYSAGIPNDIALGAIAELKMPIVEVGAGNGYWAAILQARGVDTIAYDIVSPGKRGFTRVQVGDETSAANHGDRALMIVCPPANDPMAGNTLKNYKGDTLVFVGDDRPSISGDAAFQRDLADNWRAARMVPLPNWPGGTDNLVIYKRVTVSDAIAAPREATAPAPPARLAADEVLVGDRALAIPVGGEQVLVGKSHKGFPLDRTAAGFGAVSRNHAVLARNSAGTLFVRDAGSSYGTFVNGRKIEANKWVSVPEGAEVRFGRNDREALGFRVPVSDRPVVERPREPFKLFPVEQLDRRQRRYNESDLTIRCPRTDGNSGHDKYMGDIRLADGRSLNVYVHNSEHGGKQRSITRLKNELAAYQLSRLIGFENPFPITAPREGFVARGAATKGWIQEDAGEQLQQGLYMLAGKKYGRAGTAEVSRLVQETPQLKRYIEEAFVERIVYGDFDDHAGNFTIIWMTGRIAFAISIWTMPSAPT